MLDVADVAVMASGTFSYTTNVGGNSEWVPGTYVITATDSNGATGTTVFGYSNVYFADSLSFTTSSVSYGTVGAYTGISVPVTNSWSAAQTVVIFAAFKSGTSIYVAEGTIALSAGQGATVFAIDLQSIPAGTYSVTFAAVTLSNEPVSAPIAAITVVT